jgi:hypothetical protein
MRPQSVLTALVLAAALTAGCSGLVPVSGVGSGSETATVTPVDVPAVETQVAPGVWPPESADRQRRPVETERLLAANERIRSNASYRLERVTRIESLESGDQMTIRRSRRVGSDGAVLERLAAEGTGELRPSVSNSTLWQDAERTTTRMTLANGRTVRVSSLPATPTRHRVGLDLAGRVLRDSEFRVDPAESGTAVLVTDGPTGLSESKIPVAVAPPRNSSARLTVTEAGLVGTVRVRYDTLYIEERVRVTVRHRIVDVGETSVERPAWVATTSAS